MSKYNKHSREEWLNNVWQQINEAILLGEQVTRVDSTKMHFKPDQRYGRLIAVPKEFGYGTRFQWPPTP